MSRTGSYDALGGFTLLEMLIGLLVMSMVMSGLGAILADSQQRRHLADAEMGLDEGLSRARTGAKQTGFPHLIVFYPRRVAVIARREIWSKETPAGVAVSIVSAQEVQLGGRPAIAFFGDGSSSGGTVEFQSGSRKVVRSLHWLDGGDRES